MSVRKDENEELPFYGPFSLKVKLAQTVKKEDFQILEQVILECGTKIKWTDDGDNILSSSHDGEKPCCPPFLTSVSPVVPPFISRPLTRRK